MSTCHWLIHFGPKAMPVGRSNCPGFRPRCPIRLTKCPSAVNNYERINMTIIRFKKMLIIFPKLFVFLHLYILLCFEFDFFAFSLLSFKLALRYLLFFILSWMYIPVLYPTGCRLQRSVRRRWRKCLEGWESVHWHAHKSQYWASTDPLLRLRKCD